MVVITAVATVVTVITSVVSAVVAASTRKASSYAVNNVTNSTHIFYLHINIEFPHSIICRFMGKSV